MRMPIIFAMLFSLYGCSVFFHGAKGLQISEAIKKYNIKLDEYFVIDEPPCVPRGVYGKTPDGKKITLYIGRGKYSEKCLWSIDEFMHYKVTEVEID